MTARREATLEVARDLLLTIAVARPAAALLGLAIN
jgi:hypothetical protein